jgi:hypothetical protein
MEVLLKIKFFWVLKLCRRVLPGISKKRTVFISRVKHSENSGSIAVTLTKRHASHPRRIEILVYSLKLNTEKQYFIFYVCRVA